MNDKGSGSSGKRGFGIGWVYSFGFGVAIVGLITLPPVLSEDGRRIIMSMFSNICHQLPDRSPHLGGVQLAVCHRCLGIYYSFPLAAILYRSMRGRWPARAHWAAIILFISVVPSGIDWFGDLVGIWENTPISRILTGSIIGLTAGYYLAKACSEIANDFLLNRS